MEQIKDFVKIYHIMNHFNSLSIFDDIYEKTISFINETFDVNSGYYIYNSNTNELVLYKNAMEGGPVLEKRLFLPQGFITTKDIYKGLSNTSLSNVFLFSTFSYKDLYYDEDRLYFPISIKGECIGFIVIEKGKDLQNEGMPFSDETIFFFKIIAEKVSVLLENKALYESLFDNIFDTLASLIEAIDKRDHYTKSHCQRVTDLSLRLATRLGVPEHKRDRIEIAAPIHDIGKLGMPDAILLKPDKLTEEERRLMQSHAVYGEEILNKFKILADEASIIRSHHERFDGSGYPDRIGKTDIPLCSRIIAVADAYDAMVTDRPYRGALKKKEALEEIRRCRNTQFDPELADIFICMMEKGNGGPG